MKRFPSISDIFFCVIAAVLIVSCVGAPPGQRNGGHHRKNTRIERPLSARVKSLADEVEKKCIRKSADEEDMERWTSLYAKYLEEYIISANRLTDKQCESIGYDFGRIAGYFYNDFERSIDDFCESVEKYADRSEQWAGALERGFDSVVDSNEYD